MWITARIIYQFDHLFVSVDGSAVTLWGPMQWAEEIDNLNREEPELINAHYIRHLQPDGRFIVIVRNPTERCVGESIQIVQIV